ncbi:MAG: DUF4265 domain-containing protein [Aureispira sp.]|nr:DUF4265 domain-containing protein [Aureispira sp.]
MEDSFKKVLFKYHSNVLDKEVQETMWALEVDSEKGHYQLDSIPFYGASIATNDIFKATFDEVEGFLVYQNTVTTSENSIILVMITDEAYDSKLLQQEFKNRHCDSEALNDTYFSIEILKSVDYTLIKELLDDHEIKGIINYAEPCLSKKHREDIQKVKESD